MKEIEYGQVMGLANHMRALKGLQFASAWNVVSGGLRVPPATWDELVLDSERVPSLRFDRRETKLEMCCAENWYPVTVEEKGPFGIYSQGECVIRVPFVEG